MNKPNRTLKSRIRKDSVNLCGLTLFMAAQAMGAQAGLKTEQPILIKNIPIIIVNDTRKKAPPQPPHPYMTYTAKSVSTPAGIAMMWGGLGIAGDVFNRYPTSRTDTWSGNMTVALPFGNSDKFIGGAIAVLNDSMGKNTEFGSNGTVSLVLSRAFGRNTFATAGVSNLGPWGAFKDGAYTYFGGVTQYMGFPLQKEIHPMSISVGGATGSFAPIGEVNSNGQLQGTTDNRLYPFANASFNFTKNFAIVGDYYSETFATGLAYNTTIKLPFSFMLYTSNLRHTSKAPSTTFGFRVATGLSLPSTMVATQMGR